MLLEDVGDGGIGDIVTDVRQRALDAIVAPGGVLVGEAHDEVDNLLSDAGSADALLRVAVVPLAGDEFTMPAENRVGCDDRGQLTSALRPRA